MERLSTDRSLSAFAGQFVPLKLITDGNPQWSKWATTYPAEGKGIPYLYVVRADGEKLYAKSGALPGDALPKMLLATLSQSGRRFNDAETALLEASLEEAKAALAEQNHMAAAAALGKLKLLGTPGKLNSFSTLAQEADKLAAQVVEDGKKNVETAKGQLADPATAFDGVMTLAESQEAYGGFAELNAQVVSALREVKRNDALSSPLKQAEGLIRARKFAASDNVAVRKKAASAYALVMSRFPNTPGAKLAREELTAIDPDAEALSADVPAESPAEEFRTWSDASGKFTIEAKYVQQKQGYAQLQKRDGTKLAVEIKKLSPADQQFLAER